MPNQPEYCGFGGEAMQVAALDTRPIVPPQALGIVVVWRAGLILFGAWLVQRSVVR